MRKIGELKGKPIIEGNPNEIKKNQIHYKESDGGITLSERKEDNTLSSVTSGSGSGEGVKEYYYKFLVDNSYEYRPMIAGIIPQMAIIYKIDRYNKSTYLGDIESDSQRLLYASCFSVFDCELTILEGQELSSNNKITVCPKGDLFTKIMSMNDGSEIYYQILNILQTGIQEITKEEYESMITYKP